MRHQDGSRRQRGDIGARSAQQNAQHAGADVAHVGGALAHKLVVNAGEHAGIKAANGVYRGLRTVTGIDAVVHLGQHERVVKHHDLAGENLGFLFAHAGLNVVRHGLCAGLKGLNGFLQPCLFLFLAGGNNRGVVEVLLLNTDGAADSDSGRGANTV